MKKQLAAGWKKIKVFFIAITVVAVLMLVLIQLEKAEKEQNAKRLTAETVLPVVSVIPVEYSDEALTISVFARVGPKYKSELLSQSDGQILQLNPKFLEGGIIEQGEILVTLEDVEQKAAVAVAELELAQAQLELMKEQRLAAQAKRDWQRSQMVDDTPSPLVLREPQLKAAQLQNKAAKATLKLAERQLSFTRIRAPFTGVIIARTVHPGEVVSQGQSIAQIMSANEFELVAQLTESQWQLLADNWQDLHPVIEDTSSEKQWLGDVRSTGYFYDETTQLRNIYVSANIDINSDSVLLPGRLVRLSFSGKTLEKVISVPASAYTQDAHVWMLGSDDRLQKVAPKVLASDEQRVFLDLSDTDIRFPRIALYPQSNFTLGQKVEPKQVRVDAHAEQGHSMNGAL